MVIAIIAFMFGDVHRLIYGTDTFGNVCGKNNNIGYMNNSGMDLTHRKLGLNYYV